VSNQSKQTQGTSFWLKVTHSRFSTCQRKFTTSLSVNIFEWFLHHRVYKNSHNQLKIKKCAKVLNSLKTDQGTSLFFKKWYPGSNLVIYFCLPTKKSDTLSRVPGGNGVRFYFQLYMFYLHYKVKIRNKLHVRWDFDTELVVVKKEGSRKKICLIITEVNVFPCYD